MRTNLEILIAMGGFAHLAIAISSLAIPVALKWREKLRGLDPFMRQLFWVYAGFVWGVNVMFGLVSLTQAAGLASGESLSRSVCGMVAAYWLARLMVQWFVFDVRPLVTRWWERAGYHALTVAFVFFVAVYGYAAIFGSSEVAL